MLTNADQHTVGWPWKNIWKAKAPFKVVCFSWLVAREACFNPRKPTKMWISVMLEMFVMWHRSRDQQSSVPALFYHQSIVAIVP